MERQELELATRTLAPVNGHCRACGSRELFPILELGAQPLANAFVRPEDLSHPEPRYPLDLAFCRSCALLQILDYVPTETLYGGYEHFSSVVEPLVRHGREVAEHTIEQEGLGRDSLVVELAKGDGYLLEHYRRAGMRVLAIDPVSRDEDGFGFFGSLRAARLWWDGVRPDVIHTNNAIAHQPSLNGFVAGIAMLLEAGGVAVIEAPYVKALLEERQFDTIYHEHLCYYSMTVLDRLFAAHGASLERVERAEQNAPTLRVYARRRGLARPDGSVEAVLEEDRHYGLHGPDPYLEFARAVRECKSSLRGLLADIKGEGGRIAAYGAVPQGSTLLNTFGIGAETLDWVADPNPDKQGLCMPGVRLEVKPAGALLDEMPEYCVVLGSTHVDEVIAEQAEYRARGGRFILPIPEPRIV